MDRIDYLQIIKDIEDNGVRIVRVKHWKDCDLLHIEVSQACKDRTFHILSEKYNGLFTEYGGEVVKVGICRRI